MRKLLRTTRLNFFRWRSDPKYLTVVLYIVLYLWYCIHGLCDYAQELGVGIRPWILPFLMTGGQVVCPLMLGYAILISDAPFRNRQQQFILLRTGKRTWLAGQILYLFALSVAFTLLLTAASFLYILPEVEFGRDWGSFLTTISISGLPGNYGVLGAPYSMLKGSDPLQVMLWTMVVLTFVCFLLGMIMLLCNLWAKKGVGTAVISVLVIMPLLTMFFQNTPYAYRYLTWISPMNWVDRSMLGFTGQNLPSYTYALVMPIVLSALLVVAALATIHRCNLDTDKE